MSENLLFSDTNYGKPYNIVLKRAASDAAFKSKLESDPIKHLKKAGLDISGLSQESSDLIVQQVRFFIAQPESLAALADLATSSHRARATKTTSYVEAVARPWGVVFTLSNEAVNDLGAGVSILGAITAAAAGAGGVPGAVVGFISAFFAVATGLLVLMNRGKGVYLTVPWTSFIPWPNPSFGLVVPTPVT